MTSRFSVGELCEALGRPDRHPGWHECTILRIGAIPIRRGYADYLIETVFGEFGAQEHQLRKKSDGNTLLDMSLTECIDKLITEEQEA